MKTVSKDKDPISKAELLGALRVLQTQDLIILYGEDKQKPQFKYHKDTEF